MIRLGLQEIGPITDEAWNAFEPFLQEKRLKKGTFFAMEGLPARDIAFVASGILRMYYVREDGREFNKSFVTAGDICGVLDALILNQPSRLYIDTLSPCHLFTLPWASLEALFDTYPCWSRIGRRFAYLLSVKKMRREASFLLDSAEERYRCFCNEYGGIAQLIPDYHIASYLGITPVALCRIKKRISRTASSQTL
ncbi:Crp/Fnr family transcriptional regulator [Alkalilimnicola ehrlichii]|nr:Crp/Fnr family transcriptional regulator [Alkalilimnicola ehrlichii]